MSTIGQVRRFRALVIGGALLALCVTSNSARSEAIEGGPNAERGILQPTDDALRAFDDSLSGRRLRAAEGLLAALVVSSAAPDASELTKLRGAAATLILFFLRSGLDSKRVRAAEGAAAKHWSRPPGSVWHRLYYGVTTLWVTWGMPLVLRHVAARIAQRSGPMFAVATFLEAGAHWMQAHRGVGEWIVLVYSVAHGIGAPRSILPWLRWPLMQLAYLTNRVDRPWVTIRAARTLLAELKADPAAPVSWLEASKMGDDCCSICFSSLTELLGQKTTEVTRPCSRCHGVFVCRSCANDPGALKFIKEVCMICKQSLNQPTSLWGWVRSGGRLVRRLIVGA